MPDAEVGGAILLPFVIRFWFDAQFFEASNRLRARTFFNENFKDAANLIGLAFVDNISAAIFGRLLIAKDHAAAIQKPALRAA